MRDVANLHSGEVKSVPYSAEDTDMKQDSETEEM